MKRQWKPGDVVASRAGLRLFRSGDRWIRSYPGFNGARVASTSEIGDIRPLVVLDPDDAEQVERLVRGFVHHLGDGQRSFGEQRDSMAAALRAMTKPPKPPKPPEPMGLGAVVEDAEGERWVRVPSHNSWKWLRADRPGCESYADIAVVRVLSEGVTDADL